jgi:hypothetical protein
VPLDLSGLEVEVDDSGDERMLRITGPIARNIDAPMSVNVKLAAPATAKVTVAVQVTHHNSDPQP